MGSASLTVARQPSMFGLDSDPDHDPGFADARRVRLDRGAWVDLVPGWVSGHEALFEAVLQAADWQVWDRPMFDRIVAQPRLSVSWDGGRLPAGLAPIRAMAKSLSKRYGLPLTRISANLYRDGQDSVAWHGDTFLRTQPTATVAVVSLGQPRPFRLRPRGGGASQGWSLGRGDLVVMGGTCQRTWQHAVPKVAKAGPRICVMFRTPGWDGATAPS
ncbi:MAG: alpha-ketoglutarate-dependent dioxygenase AlkB [Euzebya sp.]